MKAAMILLAFILGLAATIGMPLLIIWALNFLFHLGIPYSFLSWLAVFVIISVLGIRVKRG